MKLLIITLLWLLVTACSITPRYMGFIIYQYHEGRESYSSVDDDLPLFRTREQCEEWLNEQPKELGEVHRYCDWASEWYYPFNFGADYEDPP